MDDLIDDLGSAAECCERAGKVFDKHFFLQPGFRVLDACTEMDRAWSGSWLGHSVNVYIEGFDWVRPGERCEIEREGTDDHNNRTVGRWHQYTFEEVKAEILRRSNGDYEELQEASERAQAAIEEAREVIISALDAILSREEDEILRRLRKIIAEMEGHLPKEQFVELMLPKDRFFTSDQMADPGGLLPPHLQFKCWVAECLSSGRMVKELANLTRLGIKYLQHQMKRKGRTVAKTEGTIYIGHGRSAAWRDLKDFIQQRLNLEWEEFNRDPTAGCSTKERLEAMLDSACFAFLVMTAEDEHADGTMQARANVIHETGLFQGRLGFERAIILLEEGCSEFSNIVGLTQIRFPKGDIMSKSEEVRRVLEREGILK